MAKKKDKPPLKLEPPLAEATPPGSWLWKKKKEEVKMSSELLLMTVTPGLHGVNFGADVAVHTVRTREAPEGWIPRFSINAGTRLLLSIGVDLCAGEGLKLGAPIKVKASEAITLELERDAKADLLISIEDDGEIAEGIRQRFDIRAAED